MKMTPYFFALVCMLLWGIAPLSAKAGLVRVAPLTGLLIRNLSVGAILGMVGLLTGELARSFRVDGRSALLLILEGVLASLLGHWAYYQALKTGPASRIVPITSAFPVVALLGAVILFGERLSWQNGLGVALVITGIVLLR